MPFLQNDTTMPPATSNFIMRNPFLVFRLVMLALLTNFAFLSLIFASWNVNATLSSGVSAPSTSIFIIFESCLVFLCVALAVADFFRPQLRFSWMLMECGWVGGLSLFQVGAAIAASITGATEACRASADWNVCASASLLIPLAWLSSFISFAYFLSVFIATMAHKALYRDIWHRTVYDTEWFGQVQTPQTPPQEKAVRQFLHKSPSYQDDPYCDYYEDIESSAARKKLYRLDSIDEPAPWAPLSAVRRGVDPPFARQHGQNSSVSSSSPSLLPPLPPMHTRLPSLPGRSATTATAGNGGSRFVEKFRESSLLMRVEDPAQYTAHYHARSDSFPPTVVDVDKPIPLPRLSEWVRADGLKGMIVHSNPNLLGSS